MIFSVQKPFSYECMEVHGEFFFEGCSLFFILFSSFTTMLQLILVKALVVSKFPVLGNA